MKKSVKSFLRNQFGFSRSETNGMLLLLPIIFLSIISPYLTKRIMKSYSKDVIYEKNAALEWKKALERKLIVADRLIVKDSVHHHLPPEKKTSNKKFVFNANKVTYEQLLSLGFSSRTAKNWTNYLKAKGRFDNQGDLSKVYGISLQHLNSLSSYIRYERPNSATIRKEDFQVDKRASNYDKKRLAIREKNLNLTTTEDLKQIKGIGEKISERIVKFRDRLGGFHHLDQLYEVYGLDSSIVEKLHLHFTVSGGPGKKIRINYTTIDSLASHPYINFKTAKVILNYQKQHGLFEKPEDLTKIHILSDSLVSKIAPYLQFE